MATLSEVQREAELLSTDLYRAHKLGGIPVPPAELEEFVSNVLGADPDEQDCNDCHDVSVRARAFSRCISAPKPNEADCREALAILLEEIGVYRNRKDARREVALFANIVVAEATRP